MKPENSKNFRSRKSHDFPENLIKNAAHSILWILLGLFSSEGKGRS